MVILVVLLPTFLMSKIVEKIYFLLHLKMEELDVQVVDHRFWLARAVAHILRLLPALSRLLPSETIPIGQTLRRARGVSLTINGDSVLKVLTQDAECDVCEVCSPCV